MDYRLARDIAKTKACQPVTAKTATGEEQWERIIGTTICFSDRRTKVHKLDYVDMFRLGKVPKHHVNIDHLLYAIEEQADVAEDTEAFFNIMSTIVEEKPRGMTISVDGKIEAEHVSFRQSDKLRDQILMDRQDGKRRFGVLKIIDPSGNTTIFLPSSTVKQHMVEAIYKEMPSASPEERKALMQELNLYKNLPH